MYLAEHTQNPANPLLMAQLKRILLIDDDHDHLLICNLILRKNGYLVRSLPGCEQMEDLTEAVDTFQPDLIFMDHDMRGICGRDLVSMLKSLSKFEQIPIIYFTGRDDIILLAKEAGADDYLRKPFKPHGLIDMAGKYLANS
jgi:CheY-like chemotaxis protein